MCELIQSAEFVVNHGELVLSLRRAICQPADIPFETVFELVVQDGDSVGVSGTRKEMKPFYPEIVVEASPLPSLASVEHELPLYSLVPTL